MPRHSAGKLGLSLNGVSGQRTGGPGITYLSQPLYRSNLLSTPVTDLGRIGTWLYAHVFKPCHLACHSSGLPCHVARWCEDAEGGVLRKYLHYLS